MINEKKFKIYSKFYEYNKFKDILNNDNKIKLEIYKNKNLSNQENIEKTSNELIKFIPKDLKEKYINRFNEYNEILKNNELYSTHKRDLIIWNFYFLIVIFLLKKISLNLFQQVTKKLKKE